ncbi:hypothetical protein H3V53_20335 [Paraburkholderia bengalensis]|uniref:Uncharacterized protein n=1 Tax=Paraburkholderia bengalensis TaxID=2747562 RepID=A0ABU8IVC1_9BURK
MAVTSRKKGKNQRGGTLVPNHWAAEWTVEPAATEGWVNVALTVKQTDDVSTTQRTYRCLLTRERAGQFIRELNESLAKEATSDNLDGTAALVAARAELQAGAASSASPADDTYTTLDHFALGAYGLVGN